MSWQQYLFDKIISLNFFHTIFIIDTLHKEFDAGGDGIKKIDDCPR